MVLEMSGEMAGRQFFTRLDGTGSRAQVEIFMPAISLTTQDRTETGAVCCWCGGHMRRSRG